MSEYSTEYGTECTPEECRDNIVTLIPVRDLDCGDW